MSGIVLDRAILVPEGQYLVRYTHHETGKTWNSAKVMVHFGIVHGDYSGIPLVRYYNVKALDGPIGLNGRFSVTSNYDVAREYFALFPELIDSGRIALEVFKEKTIRADVGTTGKNGLGKELSKHSHYSVIRKLLCTVPDDYGRY